MILYLLIASLLLVSCHLFLRCRGLQPEIDSLSFKLGRLHDELDFTHKLRKHGLVAHFRVYISVDVQYTSQLCKYLRDKLPVTGIGYSVGPQGNSEYCLCFDVTNRSEHVVDEVKMVVKQLSCAGVEVSQCRIKTSDCKPLTNTQYEVVSNYLKTVHGKSSNWAPYFEFRLSIVSEGMSLSKMVEEHLAVPVPNEQRHIDTETLVSVGMTHYISPRPVACLTVRVANAGFVASEIILNQTTALFRQNGWKFGNCDHSSFTIYDQDYDSKHALIPISLPML